MPLAGQEKDLAVEVAKWMHKQLPVSAANSVAEFCKLPRLDDDSPAGKYLPILQYYLHELMENGGMCEAAQILWTPNQFTPEPESVQQVWKLFDEADMGLIMGAATLGKSYGMGVRLFLEWVRDPEWTSVRVLGPSENHLERNLFSHLVNLHQKATLPMPGEIGALFIGADRRNQLGAIQGVVIPKGNVKKAGALQGGHRRPRDVAHPIFGPLSRMFIFIDEIENVPDGIWQDIDNALSDVGQKGMTGLKIFGAYNPTNQTDKVGIRAEPPFGWDAFDLDEHFRWTSIRGWEVLRLDGEKCENVVQGKVVFPGLQTREGLERIARNAGGRESDGYLTMGRGAYPKKGMTAVVIPPGMLPKMRGEFIWYTPPQPVGAADLALDGGDEAVFTLGEWGRVSGVKRPPSIEFPQGRTVMFKDSRGQITPRWGLQAKQQFVIPPGETRHMTDQCILLCKRAGIRPEFFACDRTGHGAGVADLIRHEWSSLIHDVNYSEGAGKEKLMAEDTLNCDDLYERMCSVLWFAMRNWAEYGYFLLHPSFDLSKLTQQLTQRKLRIQGKKTKVESKSDYCSRGFGSPNDADSLTLLVQAARKGSGLVLSMRGEPVDLPEGMWGEEDSWPGREHHIDATNRVDFLDESPGPARDAWSAQFV